MKGFCLDCKKEKEDGRAKRCNECSYCKHCKIKISGEKCTDCYKKCYKCKSVKLKTDYPSKGAKQCKDCHNYFRKCIECKIEKHKDEYSALKTKKCMDCCKKIGCIKCGIALSEENKVPGRNTCKNCTNRINRERNAKKLEHCPEKACTECKYIKNVKKYYISALHKKCKDCTLKNTKYLSRDEYDIKYKEQTRICSKCNINKPIDSYSYKRWNSNYSKSCKICDCYRTSYKNYISKKDTKITTEEFSKEEFNVFVSELILFPCFYCGQVNSPYNKNGIDRLDSDYNYSVENCVSCCGMCNMMKKDMDIGSFVRKCCEIYGTHSNDRRLRYHENIDLSNKTQAKYDNYQRKAEQRKLKFTLTKEEFYDIIEENCVYCHGESEGIDRVDNEEGYIKDNCVPCCKYCNYIKRDYDVDEFQEHIAKIESHTRNNDAVHSKCITAEYHQVRCSAKLIIEENDCSDTEDVVFDDYILGFLDSTCSITKDCVYIISKKNITHLKNINDTYFNNIFQMNNDRLALKQKNKRIKFLEKYYELSPKNKTDEELSYEYIAGMFDAHGTIQKYDNYLVVRITHKHKDLLIQLMNIYYDLHISEDNIIIYSKKAQIEFFTSIVDYLIVKKQQVTECIGILEYKENLIDVKNFKKNIEDIKKYSPRELLIYNKNIEMENFTENKKYNNLVYSSLDKVQPKLIFCETAGQHNLWSYYRDKTSSICFSGSVGRCVRILVMDKNTSKYIGIVSISSDLPNYKARDDYIKKFYPNKKAQDYLDFIGNLSTCVPLQPFGYNCNGGKLLVKLSFSKEVFDYWYNKYNQPLLIINTLSINGKSVQYDRLKELKFTGFTKGKSAYHIPQKIMEDANHLFKKQKLNLSTKRVGRMDKLVKLLNHLKIDDKILCHDIKKGMYVGWMFSSKLDLKYSITELKTVSQMTEEWYNRWCVQRVRHLTNENRLRLV